MEAGYSCTEIEFDNVFRKYDCVTKLIRFKFRVDYDAEAGGKVLLNENDVESIALLLKLYQFLRDQ